MRMAWMIDHDLIIDIIIIYHHLPSSSSFIYHDDLDHSTTKAAGLNVISWGSAAGRG